MADSALQGAWAKWRRALEHVEHLGAHEQEWVALHGDAPAVTFRTEVQSQPRRGRIIVEAVQDLGSEPSVLIGDVLNNLRGALDYVAWQLYIRGGAHTSAEGEQARQVAWPLVRRRRDWRRTAERMLPGVGSGVLAQVEALQPYHRHVWSAGLQWLSEVHGPEKHRELRPGLVVLPHDGVRVRLAQPFDGRMKVTATAGVLEPGSRLVEFIPRSPTAQLPMNMSLEVLLRLGLGDGVAVMQHIASLQAAALAVMSAAPSWLSLGQQSNVNFPPVVPPCP